MRLILPSPTLRTALVKSLLVATLTERMGGAERMIERLLPALASSYDVTLGLVQPRKEKGSGEPGIAWSGPTVGLREILFGRYDVIHTHLFLPGLLVRLRRSWDGSFRWVHTVHYGRSLYDSVRLGRLRQWLDHRFVFPQADRVVAVSDLVARELAEPPHLRVIPNGIDLEPGTRAPHPSGDGTTVGTVAHLRREKGVDLLVEAARVLVDRGRSVRFRVAGSGPEGERLAARIRELGLEGVVELTGFVSDLDAFYRSLDVYVQPSRQESFGIAALESMRFGLPLVARAVDNLPTLLGRGRYGVLVDRGPDPVRALADGIERALDDRSELERRSREGLDHWRERVSPEAMLEGHLRLYAELEKPAVCMIAPVATQGSGGLQRQLLLQSRELARRGHRVFLVQRSDPELDAPGRKAERWRHVTVLGTGRLNGGAAGPGGVLNRLRGLTFIAAGFWRLWQIRRRVDVLHAHQLHSPTLLGSLGKLAFSKPLITKVTSSGEMGELSEVKRLPFGRTRRLAFRAVDRLLVLTPHMEKEMAELGFPSSRIRLVPNAVEIPPTPAGQPKSPDSPFRVLFTGRLSTEKRLEDLLDAAGRLAGEGTEVEVELVGPADPDRNAEPTLRERAAALPGTVRVLFRGRLAEVEPFYRAADVFVLSSSTEGLSNALLEAMAHGLPCVVSDIPQNRFTVGDAGLLYPMGDAGELSERLRSLLRDRAGGGRRIRRLAEAARARAVERFSVEAVVDALEEEYRGASGRPEPDPGAAAPSSAEAVG